MAKFYGTIGYVTGYTNSDGIYESLPVEKKYCGDLLKNFTRKEGNAEINDSANISNQVSIVADPYAMEHFFEMTYLKFEMPKMAGVWRINSVEVEYPRLVISLGGLYNGEQA